MNIYPRKAHQKQCYRSSCCAYAAPIVRNRNDDYLVHITNYVPHPFSTVRLIVINVSFVLPWTKVALSVPTQLYPCSSY